MSKQYFTCIDDIVDYYVVPALGRYADDFDLRNIAYHIFCRDGDREDLCVDTDEFGNVLTWSGDRVSFWDIARRYDLGARPPGARF